MTNNGNNGRHCTIFCTICKTDTPAVKRFDVQNFGHGEKPGWFNQCRKCQTRFPTIVPYPWRPDRTPEWRGLAGQKGH